MASRSQSRYLGVVSSGKLSTSWWAAQAAVGWSVTLTWTCPSPKPHPTQWTTADALATGQGTFRRRQTEGRPAVRVRRLATFWGGAASSLRKDGPDRGEPIEWIRPPVGRSDGGGHRLRESG